MRNNKGISPLIATVLIIGFTIVLAALVFTWGGDLFKGFQSETGKSAELSTTCSYLLTGVDIRGAKYTTASGLSEAVVDNNNPQGINITKVDLKVYYGAVGEATVCTSTTAIQPGEAKKVSCTITKIPAGTTATKIGVYGYVKIETADGLQDTKCSQEMAVGTVA